jgi:hypothetical protein
VIDIDRRCISKHVIPKLALQVFPRSDTVRIWGAAALTICPPLRQIVKRCFLIAGGVFTLTRMGFALRHDFVVFSLMLSVHSERPPEFFISSFTNFTALSSSVVS